MTASCICRCFHEGRTSFLRHLARKGGEGEWGSYAVKTSTARRMKRVGGNLESVV